MDQVMRLRMPIPESANLTCQYRPLAVMPSRFEWEVNRRDLVLKVRPSADGTLSEQLARRALRRLRIRQDHPRNIPIETLAGCVRGVGIHYPRHHYLRRWIEMSGSEESILFLWFLALLIHHHPHRL